MRIWGIKPLSWSPAIVSDQHDTGRWGSSWTRSDPVIERLKFCKNFQNDYLPKGIVHKKPSIIKVDLFSLTIMSMSNNSRVSSSSHSFSPSGTFTDHYCLKCRLKKSLALKTLPGRRYYEHEDGTLVWATFQLLPIHRSPSFDPVQKLLLDMLELPLLLISV